MPTPGTKRVIIEFPENLLRRTEQAASELATSRSVVIRSAVEEFLSAMRRRELERILAEGYAANAAMDRHISEEFSSIDSEEV
jgi:metal-responsive CopG/Arc/MetJ family transcriptional regulator